MARLEGKVAVITGGNSGIGATAARLFAAEGAAVVICARRKEPLETVAEEIRTAGGKVLVHPADISVSDQADQLMQDAVDTFGKVDILVNNAGVLEPALKGINQFNDEDLHRLIEINTVGTMHCMRAALKVMHSPASIVNVASVAGVIGNGGAAYVASKAAVLGVSRHTAMRFAADGIRCNAVCPGTVATPMTAGLASSAGNLDMGLMGEMHKHSDLKLPICKPDDIANILVFLASDESRAITGQTLVADFGSTL